MAILLRSVKANGEPITAALRDAGIPFVVTGMTNLFGTAEAVAARALFYFIAERQGVDAPALRNAWATANLGLDSAALDRAVSAAMTSKFALTDPEEI
jgi:DNA helicase-2/ATP-dependent DNA helicase PcrA